jgi:hypothetical protein
MKEKANLREKNQNFTTKEHLDLEDATGGIIASTFRKLTYKRASHLR